MRYQIAPSGLYLPLVAPPEPPPVCHAALDCYERHVLRMTCCGPHKERGGMLAEFKIHAYAAYCLSPFGSFERPVL